MAAREDGVVGVGRASNRRREGKDTSSHSHMYVNHLLHLNTWPGAVQSRKRGEGSSASAAAAVVRGGGGGTWAAAACCAVQHTQRGTAQSSVKWAVQPMCHTHFVEGRVRPWKRVRVQCLVAWCLRWMAAGQGPAATHKWERRRILNAPPPKGQRGLLVSAAAAACSNPDGGGGSSVACSHTHACMLVSRHSLSSTHVCCVAWHHTPLPRRWKKQSHWLLESNRRKGGGGSKEALLSCPLS